MTINYLPMRGGGSCHKNITVVCMDRNVILIMTQPKSSIKKILFFHHYHYDLSLSITCLNLKLDSHVLLIPLKIISNSIPKLTKSIPIFRPKQHKTIYSGVVHTYLASLNTDNSKIVSIQER